MTHLKVSDFGSLVQGCAAFGGLFRPISDEQAAATLDAGWEQGIRAFDTAPHYGAGLSEERVGAFLATKPREEFSLSTKVGRLLVDDPEAPDEGDMFFDTPRRRRVRDYSAAGVRQSLHESLQRMGLDRIDLVLIHDPEDYLESALTEAAPALRQLRDEGTIGGFGVGTNYADVAMRFATETDVDHVMIAGRYSLLDRRASELLHLCADRDIDVLVAAVFNSGLLADPAHAANFEYAPAPEVLVEAAFRMQDACQRHDVTLRAAAMQFPLRHPGVDAVVAGPTTPEMVADCVQQQQIMINEDLWAELDSLIPDQSDLP